MRSAKRRSRHPARLRHWRRSANRRRDRGASSFEPASVEEIGSATLQRCALIEKRVRVTAAVAEALHHRDRRHEPSPRPPYSRGIGKPCTPNSAQAFHPCGRRSPRDRRPTRRRQAPAPQSDRRRLQLLVLGAKPKLTAAPLRPRGRLSRRASIIDLAGRRARQVLGKREAVRNHVRRQDAGAETFESTTDGPGAWQKLRNASSCTPRFIRPRDDAARAPRMRCSRLPLAELHAVAAPLHHAIAPAEKS